MKKDRCRFGFRGKRGCLIVCQKVQLWGSGGKARLDGVWKRLSQGSALSGTKARAGKLSGSLLSCV